MDDNERRCNERLSACQRWHEKLVNCVDGNDKEVKDLNKEMTLRVTLLESKFASFERFEKWFWAVNIVMLLALIAFFIAKI